MASLFWTTLYIYATVADFFTNEFTVITEELKPYVQYISLEYLLSFKNYSFIFLNEEVIKLRF